MKITILTAGTRGDTQPYVALGADFSAMMNSPQAQAVLDSDNPIKMLLFQMKASQSVNRLMERLLDDVWVACQGADAILYSPGQPNGYYIARHLGIPCIQVNAVPMTPTRTQPAALFYSGPRLGGAYNLLTHAIFDLMFWQGFRQAIKSFWRTKSPTTRIPFAAPFGQQRSERLPVLYGYSEHVLPRPTDWPDYACITGYWFVEEEPAWSPPTALVDFLHAGPPPVYIGFGNMGSKRRALETTEMMVKALELSGHRGLLASGWNGLNQDVQLPNTVFMVESAPHTWLFPQVAAVVHHGGAGTTAAGVRAGIPSIIVPHAVDQPMWGQRIAELGVGPQPIPRKQLTAERLAQAITATNDAAMRARAGALGRTIRAENGVARAVEVIDNLLNR